MKSRRPQAAQTARCGGAGGADTLEGGDGSDTIAYGDSNIGVYVSLYSGAAFKPMVVTGDPFEGI